MGNPTMKKLLQADEEKVKKTIQTIDKNRKQCIESLGNEFDSILRKYNSAYPQDKVRQSAANAEVSVIRRTLDVLMLPNVTSEKKEVAASKEQNPKIPVFAIIAAVLCVVTAILIITKKLAPLGVLCLFASVCFALLSDKIGSKEEKVEPRESSVTIDPEKLWNTLIAITGIMDEKIEELLARSNEYIKSQIKVANEEETAKSQNKASKKAETVKPQNKASNEAENVKPQNTTSNEAETIIMPNLASSEGETLDHDTLQMFGYLLETLYFWDGVHAHNQLKNIRMYLKKLGIELKDYDGSNEEMFELLPSRHNNKTATLRPAMVSNNKLLMKGHASKPDVRRIFI